MSDMVRGKITNFSISKILMYIALLIVAVIQLFPLYWMFSFSLKDNSEIFGGNPIGLPGKWLWSNYSNALTQGNVGRYFTNSVIVTTVTILLTSIIAVMASYALTRMVFRIRKPLNSFFILGLTVPLHSALLPIFIMLRSLKMVNSYWALIAPYTAFAIPMAILIFSGFMGSIPREMEEAACIDGCSIYKIFFTIILPLMRPAIATVTIFTFLQAWNELMFAVVFISDAKYKTLTVGIQSLAGQYTTEWGPIGAGLMVATIPTLIIYAIMSKKVQDSLVVGAVKG
ncbi:carbohydrate ABC transporter permease [Ruminiclostridium cellulolyticum]|uniref:Binding-protein-dependent transport systems inner membrane component n=1 Tax=Ruminiclostridium cellulolyticum (strain ATCC 35319 / DSM 5812 / JCM 6584 / H10) TaxID=394503 RepID=B8I509_RUMCH|nr:carbohydrate ABC transporter permease [Ruminiclostridium cellulolyticum]ACL74589.1 binding-protein-dependent transport systems inner membrane component [Ruminiclostridium cellulolyticum H10]